LAYDLKAQELVYGYYARGWSKERALPEIRKVYPGFAGSTWDEWVKKLDWPQRRALADAKLREFEDLCRDTTRTLLLELNEIREKLIADVRDGKADTQTYYAFNSVAKQIAEMSRQHLASQDPQKVAVEVISQAVDRLLTGLRGIDGLERPLAVNAREIGQLVTQISEEFGREMRA
jgi:methyl-accepting chemotaxis protein